MISTFTGCDCEALEYESSTLQRKALHFALTLDLGIEGVDVVTKSSLIHVQAVPSVVRHFLNVDERVFSDHHWDTILRHVVPLRFQEQPKKVGRPRKRVAVPIAADNNIGDQAVVASEQATKHANKTKDQLLVVVAKKEERVTDLESEVAKMRKSKSHFAGQAKKFKEQRNEWKTNTKNLKLSWLLEKGTLVTLVSTRLILWLSTATKVMWDLKRPFE